jgi:hypothetical protein
LTGVEVIGTWEVKTTFVCSLLYLLASSWAFGQIWPVLLWLSGSHEGPPIYAFCALLKMPQGELRWIISSRVGGVLVSGSHEDYYVAIMGGLGPVCYRNSKSSFWQVGSVGNIENYINEVANDKIYSFKCYSMLA